MVAFLDFHPKMIGLTGSPEQIQSFAKLYRVYFSKNTETKENEDYLVDHSVFFYLMGPHGKFVDFFGREMSTEQISLKISQYIQQAKNVGLFMPKMDNVPSKVQDSLSTKDGDDHPHNNNKKA